MHCSYWKSREGRFPSIRLPIKRHKLKNYQDLRDKVGRQVELGAIINLLDNEMKRLRDRNV